MIPLLVVLFIVYRVLVKELPEKKSLFKKIFNYSLLGILVIFGIVILRFASLNEIQKNDVDHSIKKDRQEEMIERAKKDTVTN